MENLFPLSITFYKILPYLKVLAMHHNSKQLQQLQADLAAVHAEILKLQQENAILRKQLAPKLPTTNILTFSIWTHHITSRFFPPS